MYLRHQHAPGLLQGNDNEVTRSGAVASRPYSSHRTAHPGGRELRNRRVCCTALRRPSRSTCHRIAVRMTTATGSERISMYQLGRR